VVGRCHVGQMYVHMGGQTDCETSFKLCLHYVPGDHGSPVCPERSAMWDFDHFCHRVQVLLRLVKFSHGLLRYQ